MRYRLAEGSLYVAFEVRDSDAAAIRARKRERDAIYDEDSVGVVIAPAGTGGAESFSFYVSAGGTQFDARWTEANSTEDTSWNARWTSAAQLHAQGYTVEMRIPLSALPLPAGQTQNWAWDFVRIMPRDYRYQMASQPRDRNRGCSVCQLQSVPMQIEQQVDWLGLQARVDLVHQRDALTATDAPPRSQSRSNVGADVTWRPLYNFNATLSLNPDFSQVESDVLRPVTNAADAFFYDEQRPFFVDAGQPFSQSLPLFYSRSISDPDAALYAAYRNPQGQTTLVVAQDAVTQLIVPGVEGSRLVRYERLGGESLPSRTLALRSQGNWAGSTLGATLTSRQAEDYHNHVLALDARTPLSLSTTLNASLALSDTQDGFSGLTGNRGHAAFLKVSRNTLDWTSYLSYDRYSENFRADLGSVFRVGVHRLQGAAKRTWRFEPGGVLSEAGVQLDGWRREEIGGGLVDRRTQLSLSLAGTGQTQATLWLINGQSRYNQQLWQRNGWEFALDTAPTEHWKAALGLLRIGDVDRIGLRQAKLDQVATTLNWTPSDSVQWQWRRTMRWLGVDQGRLFSEQFDDLRGYYYFNNSLYLRGTLRAWTLANQPALYPGQQIDQRLRSRDLQLLLAWRPTVGTSLYVGVSTGRDVDDVSPLAAYSTQQRTWFVKLSLSFDRDGLDR